MRILLIMLVLAAGCSSSVEKRMEYIKKVNRETQCFDVYRPRDISGKWCLGFLGDLKEDK